MAYYEEDYEAVGYRAEAAAAALNMRIHCYGHRLP